MLTSKFGGFWACAFILGVAAFGQTPPTATPAAGQTPAQTPAPAKPAITTTPAAAPSQPTKRELDPVDEMFSLGVFYWRPGGTPGFRAGKSVPDPTSGHLDLTKNPKRGNGFLLTIPTGHYNKLEIAYWRLYDSGDVRAPNKIDIFGASVQNNERLNTYYKLSNVKVAWNYLTFPAPPFDAKLRIKTFWEVQFVRMDPTIGFPDARNNPPPIRPKQTLLYPGAGLGAEYLASKHFRLEARGSGMALPGRSAYWDIEGSAVARIRRVEVFASMKGFHFRTSAKQPTYIQGTYWGPSFGLRWVFKP